MNSTYLILLVLIYLICLAANNNAYKGPQVVEGFSVSNIHKLAYLDTDFKILRYYDFDKHWVRDKVRANPNSSSSFLLSKKAHGSRLTARGLSNYNKGGGVNHMSIYNNVLEYLYSAAVIIDRKVELNDRFWRFIVEIPRHLPRDWDVVYLSMNRKPGKKAMLRKKQCNKEAFGYIVSRKGAYKMYRMMFAMSRFRQVPNIEMEEFCLSV